MSSDPNAAGHCETCPHVFKEPSGNMTCRFNPPQLVFYPIGQSKNPVTGQPEIQFGQVAGWPLVQKNHYCSQHPMRQRSQFMSNLPRLSKPSNDEMNGVQSIPVGADQQQE